MVPFYKFQFRSYDQFYSEYVFSIDDYGQHSIIRRHAGLNFFQAAPPNIPYNHPIRFPTFVQFLANSIQKPKPTPGYHYQKPTYRRPYEKVRFDDAPDPIYGFTVRTRQLSSCERDFSNECAKLEEKGKVVECQQDRFRYAY